MDKTPWTLPSNVALCVNPDEIYCKVKAADGYTYYMAEALLDKVLGKLAKDDEPAYEILEKYKGTDLERREYEPLFACAGEAAAKQHKKAHFVTCDNYVTMSDGTGIVLKPVTETTLTDALWNPVDSIVVTDQIILYCSHLDEPGLTCIVDKRCVTSPAVRIIMLEFRCVKKLALFVKVCEDHRVRFLYEYTCVW